MNYIENAGKELDSTNNNSFDSTVFLKARLFDVFIGDWDLARGDQWRFVAEKNEYGWKYIPLYPGPRSGFLYQPGGCFLTWNP